MKGQGNLPNDLISSFEEVDSNSYMCFRFPQTFNLWVEFKENMVTANSAPDLPRKGICDNMVLKCSD